MSNSHNSGNTVLKIYFTHITRVTRYRVLIPMNNDTVLVRVTELKSDVKGIAECYFYKINIVGVRLPTIKENAFKLG